mmetsp:Transcript_14889/g.22169  ORF Transcript_14889/g.22169 Transcript_14889/m.22169 type:complete len:109 (-) Transcript_14889:109-435(-)
MVQHLIVKEGIRFAFVLSYIRLIWFYHYKRVDDSIEFLFDSFQGDTVLEHKAFGDITTGCNDIENINSFPFLSIGVVYDIQLTTENVGPMEMKIHVIRIIDDEKLFDL